MEIKWYWLAERMGLVQNTSHLYNDGNIYYEVSAKTDEFFMNLTLLLIPSVFVLGFLIRFFANWGNREQTGQKALCVGSGILLGYALLLAAGAGPYIEFYPQGGGFLDLDFIGHIVQGIYCALLALLLFLGGRLGNFLARCCKTGKRS